MLIVLFSNNTLLLACTDSLPPSIIYCEKGQFGPFAPSTSWTYSLHQNPQNQKTINHTRPSQLTIINQGDTIIQNKQYFRLGNQLIRVKHQKYYYRLADTDVLYFDENAKKGHRWQTPKIYHSTYENGDSVFVAYTFQVLGTNIQVKTPLGIITQVTAIGYSEKIYGLPYHSDRHWHKRYYKAGVGLVRIDDYPQDTPTQKWELAAFDRK